MLTQVLTLLNESRADYEVVNVLDDLHNPGLRETIKSYSQWPTIPQVCVSCGLLRKHPSRHQHAMW